MSLILGMGANKYAARNWEKGLDYSAIVGAIGRHMALWASGQRVDTESGLSHMAHVACMSLFAVAHELRGVGNDDMPEHAWRTMVAELLNPQDINGPMQPKTFLEAVEDELSILEPERAPGQRYGDSTVDNGPALLARNREQAMGWKPPFDGATKEESA